MLPRDLLLPHGDAVIALSAGLRIKRALDGAEIDSLISDLLGAQKRWRWGAIGGRNGIAPSRVALRFQLGTIKKFRCPIPAVSR